VSARPLTSAMVSEWTFEMNLWVNDCHDMRGASRTGDEVDHAVRPRMGVAVENRVDRPAARDLVLIASARPTRSRRRQQTGRADRPLRVEPCANVPDECESSEANQSSMERGPKGPRPRRRSVARIERRA
jgi:hypothetical protein